MLGVLLKWFRTVFFIGDALTMVFERITDWIDSDFDIEEIEN